MTTDPRNTFPGKYGEFETWSGNPAQSKRNPDGRVFWGLNMRNTKTKIIWYFIYSIDAAGKIEEHLRLLGAGQGLMDLDWNDDLVLTVFHKAGDGQPADRMLVPGWKLHN